MPKESWNSLKTISDRPDLEKLEIFLTKMVAEKGEEIEFVVLFGSMAKGNWSLDSDFDLLVGLNKEDGKRLTDRIYEYSHFSAGRVETIIYSRSEIRRMFKGLNPMLLEPLEYGIPLLDRGEWARLKKEFSRLREMGIISPIPMGWEINQD